MSFGGWIGAFVPAVVFASLMFYALVPRRTDRGDSQ